MNRILSVVMWTGKATTFLLGLIVALALAVAVAAGTAEAAKAPTLKLGVQNAVGAITSMAGSVAGPVLRLDNNSTAVGATALDLQVEAGKAPLTINSTAGKATNLDADELDGRDSSSFLGKTEKAADANRLDGLDSTQFVGATAPMDVVAAGHINSEGRILEATSNVGSVQITGEGFFRIDLVGINYDNTEFVSIAMATPRDRAAHTQSVGGDLLVITENLSGDLDSATFTFVIYDVS